MNVFLLVHGLPVGGTEVMVTHLARELRREGIGVGIGCLDEIGDLGEELRSEGFRLDLFSRKPGLDVALPRRIARRLKEGRFDVLHAHQYTCYFYGVFAKVLAGVPLVFTEHGRFYPDLPSTKRRLFNFLFSRMADRITAVSKGVKESLRGIEGFRAERIEVLYNGIDVERFPPMSPQAKREAKARLGHRLPGPLIGTIGRLDPIKNQGLLIAALALLSPKVPGLALAIVGDGPERKRLGALADGLGVAERVYFLGKRTDIVEVLSALDVFALSSFSEGTPMTILEAMAASLPIVSTAVGGIPEVLTDGVHAFLVEGVPPRLEDPRTLLAGEYTRRYAGALERAILGPSESAARAQGARERVEREFSLEAITLRYRALYETVARSTRTRAPVAARRQ